MSYDIEIVFDGEHLDSPIVHHVKGGTYALGGSKSLETNITFNYSQHFQKVFQNEEGIKSLDGVKCIDAIPLIVEAMRRLGDDETSNYWDPTEGNAKRALEGLLHIAALGYNGRIAIFY